MKFNLELDKNISYTTDKEFSCVADGFQHKSTRSQCMESRFQLYYTTLERLAMDEEVGFVRVGTVGLPVACGRSELYARACLVADLPGYRGHSHSPAEPRGSAECRHCTQPEKLSPRPHRLLFS